MRPLVLRCRLTLASAITGHNQKQRLRLLEQTFEQATGQKTNVGTLSAQAHNTSTALPTSPDDNPLCLSSTAQDSWLPSFNFSPAFNNMTASGPQTNNGRTALHLAVSRSNESLTQVLLQHGADFERQDAEGQTALHIAAKLGSHAIVQLLLERMASVEVKDDLGRTALFYAVQSENEAVVKLLLETAIDLDCTDVLGNVALHLAVEMESESITLLLLSSGANINA